MGTICFRLVGLGFLILSFLGPCANPFPVSTSEWHWQSHQIEHKFLSIDQDALNCIDFIITSGNLTKLAENDITAHQIKIKLKQEKLLIEGETAKISLFVQANILTKHHVRSSLKSLQGSFTKLGENVDSKFRQIGLEEFVDMLHICGEHFEAQLQETQALLNR